VRAISLTLYHLNRWMSRPEAAEAMLKKLESFGKRATEKIFSELVSIEIPTNT